MKIFRKKKSESVKDRKVIRLLKSKRKKKEIKRFIENEIIDKEKVDEALSDLIERDKRMLEKRSQINSELDENETN